jgi:hypothetical protein
VRWIEATSRSVSETKSFDNAPNRLVCSGVGQIQFRFLNSKLIAVLGSGSFGTAMATVIARNGYQARQACHDMELAESTEQIHDSLGNRASLHSHRL